VYQVKGCVVYTAQRALLRYAQLKLPLPDLPAAWAVPVAAHNVARSWRLRSWK
jgi:hypothetical protein